MKANCPVNKNEIYTLNISSIGSNGEGIGHIDGYTLFVRDALPGDQVMAKVIKVKKNYGFAIMTDILEPSPDRVEPICPVSSKCGGCSIMHMHYDAQLRCKEELIKDALERIGGVSRERLEGITEPIIKSEMPLYYRNKVQYPVRDNDGRLEIGFYAKRSHRIVETKRCYIQDVYVEEIIKSIKAFMETYEISAYNEERHKGLVRHIVIRKSRSKDCFHVTLVINGKRLPNAEAFADQLMGLNKVEAVSLNINCEKTNVILGPRLITLSGPTHLVDNIKDITYQISPLSFYQVNPVQTEKLYEKALEYAGLTGSEEVFDLYCGIGTISLFLARQAKKVYGVEIVGAAVDDARENARINQISNTVFYTGKAEEVVPRLYEEEGVKADVVVVDPPRKGCDEILLKTIVDMSPNRIVYVSCDPGTLARDVKYLEKQGYLVDKVCGVDMFGQSMHVECVVGISRKH